MGKAEKFFSQILQQTWCVNKTLHFSHRIASRPAPSTQPCSWLAWDSFLFPEHKGLYILFRCFFQTLFIYLFSRIDYYFCYHRDFRLPPAEGKDALRGCSPSYTVYGQHWKLLGQLIPALQHSTLIQHQLVLVQHLQFLWREAKILVIFHFHFLQNSWKMHFVILHCKITEWV